MSHHHLQRVVVRALHDPQFVARLATQTPDALGLTPEEYAWLKAVDPRLWDLDPLRRSRRLKPLLDEFPLTSTHLGRSQGLKILDAFFSSNDFHEAIQQRGRLIHAYAAYTQAIATNTQDALLMGLSQLEHGIAQARRGSDEAPRPVGERWMTPPHLVPLNVPSGTLAAYVALMEGIGQHPSNDPLAALVDGDHPLPSPAVEDIDEHVLIANEGGPGPGISTQQAELVTLLQIARAPKTLEQLRQPLSELGLDVDEHITVLGSLTEDGLLVRVV